MPIGTQLVWLGEQQHDHWLLQTKTREDGYFVGLGVTHVRNVDEYSDAPRSFLGTR